MYACMDHIWALAKASGPESDFKAIRLSECSSGLLLRSLIKLLYWGNPIIYYILLYIPIMVT